MNTRMPWYCWLFYYDPADPRRWVPKRIGAGWTLNFAHPSAMTSFARLAYGSLGAAAVALSLWRFRLLRSDPNILLWLAGSMAAALAAYLLNPLSWCRDAWRAGVLSFGVLAAVSGFAAQGLLNGPVVAALGAENLTWRSHLYLAAVASAAQTSGKYLAIVLALKVAGIAGGRRVLRTALLIGLGFTVFEIALLWISAVAHASAGPSLLGIWERGSASLFHIYSAGLVGVFAAARVRWCLALVLAVHFAMDWCAGANASLLHLSVVRLEAVFTAAAAAVWIAFLSASGGTPPERRAR